MTKIDVTNAMRNRVSELHREMLTIRDDEIGMIQRSINRMKAGDKEGWKELSFDNTSQIINRLVDAISACYEDIDGIARNVYNEEC